ncbi:MAG TPA: type I-U CRISPR-associated protein Csx17 [Bryobacteraceae bacterium]|nr:type I-U CRISPR-associated protein Csx17 [Bryobacteraceae bacterium]
MPELILNGCRPEPLMSYLKALGVLRLVSKQADPEARGCWRDDMFVLNSELDRDALAKFFLNKYKPTPLIGPWGARSGFYAGSSEKKARQALETIMDATDPRFAPFREMVSRVRDLLRQLHISEKAKDEQKLALLLACRSQLPDEILPWLDTCYVLLGDDRRFPPLLGTGGNEGSGSYFSGFAQQLVACLVHRKHDQALETALCGTSQEGIYADQTPGHFSPTAAGGANGTQGFEASVATNPWDYLLALEGTCLWASSVVRRCGQTGTRMASFPFTVNVSAAGSVSLAQSDGVKPKQAKREIAEVWLPLWVRPASLQELMILLTEGRASVGDRMATTGLDMARAVTGLGVDRGISEFRRVAFLMRNGQSFLAVPVSTVHVCEREPVDFVRQLDPWLGRFRWACEDKNAPPRLKIALRDVEQAIFEFCLYGGRAFFQAIVIAIGRAERQLALTTGKIGNRTVSPITGLTPDWVRAANDNSSEFEIALALAGIHDAERKIDPLRCNLEPVAVWHGKNRALDWKWAEKDRAVVWNSADLSANLAAVLRRRLMDAGRNGCANLPLAATNFASFGAVSRFLAGELDEQRIDDLLWGLILLLQSPGMLSTTADKDAPPLPRAYALLKLLFLPDPLTINGLSIAIKPEPSIVNLPIAGRVGEACQIAMRRLRASGLSPLPHPRSRGRVRDADWKELDCLGADGVRLAAALLLPISHASINHLRKLVIREAATELQTPS